MSRKNRGDHHAGTTSRKPKKRIFLFSDGTGNAASTLTKTNVWRMYQALEKGDGDDPLQVALYDNGVATSSLRPIAIVTGVFGFGVKRNVLDLYRFLCLHYEEDAEIFLIGFSRGAFTMRLLAAMVQHNGIIKVRPQENGISPEDIDRAGNIAFQRLSDLFRSYNPLFIPLRKIRNALTSKKFGPDKIHFDDLERHASRDITFMGLFETVSAYGGPIEEFTNAFSILFFPTEPKDWSIGTHVRKVCHALALDEPRHSFWPKLVNEAKDANWNDPKKVPTLERGTRIEQVWFSGAHAHVGGGYANDGLSMIPLNWMFEKLIYGYGIRFDESAIERFQAAEDCCAPMADPRDGLGFIYRYNPRNLSRMTEDAENKIYTGTPKIHHSVFDRMAKNPDYAPIAINRDFEIVDPIRARDHHTVTTRKIDFQFDEKEWLKAHTNGEAHVDDATKMNPLFTAKRFNAHVEAAWDGVWKRRVIFAVQMILMFILVASPWLMSRVENSECHAILCFLREPVKGAAALLPGPAQPWADVFSTHPTTITILLFLFGLTILVGRTVRYGINATLIDYWQYLVGRTDKKPDEPKKSGLFVLRNQPWYRVIFHKGKHAAMTGFFMVLIMTILILVFNQVALYIRDRSAPIMAICDPPKLFVVTPAKFKTRDLCVDTGIEVEKGQRYTVAIRPEPLKGQPPIMPWLDDTIPASPRGLKPTFYNRMLNVWAFSVKRHPSRALFTPIVAIGDRFPQLQRLVVETRAEKLLGSYPRVWTATFTASESGRAFFYMNDAINGFASRSSQPAYRNNRGGGTIEIKPAK